MEVGDEVFDFELVFGVVELGDFGVEFGFEVEAGEVADDELGGFDFDGARDVEDGFALEGEGELAGGEGEAVDGPWLWGRRGVCGGGVAYLVGEPEEVGADVECGFLEGEFFELVFEEVFPCEADDDLLDFEDFGDGVVG